MQSFDKSYKTFTSLEEYIAEFSSVLNISVKSFTYFFFLYILFNSTVLLLFCVLAIRRYLVNRTWNWFRLTRKHCESLSDCYVEPCVPLRARYRCAN